MDWAPVLAGGSRCRSLRVADAHSTGRSFRAGGGRPLSVGYGTVTDQAAVAPDSKPSSNTIGVKHDGWDAAVAAT